MNGLSKGETSITSKHTTQENNVCYRGNGDGHTIILGICLDENLQPSSSTTSWVLPTHLLCITTCHVLYHVSLNHHYILPRWILLSFSDDKGCTWGRRMLVCAGLRLIPQLAFKHKSMWLQSKNQYLPRGSEPFMGNAMTGNKACTKAGKDFKS